MSGFTAVLDACVLYPASLRDLLMSLAVEEVYRAKWSAEIHDEWTRNLLKDRPDIPTARLQRTCKKMNDSVPDSLVTGYEPLIESVTLKDPDDRHVVAAAIRCNADSIVTFNTKDFDEVELMKFDLYCEHPDDFVSNMITLYPHKVIPAVREMLARLKNPPQTINELLETFLKLPGGGLPQSVKKLSAFAESLSPHKPKSLLERLREHPK